MSQLILLRHAKSDWNSDAIRDFDRPLSRRGQRDAPRVGRWMHFHGLRPGLVVCSSAVRTRETLQGVATELNLSNAEIRYDGDLYHASESTVIAIADAAMADAESVMLIGHNPGFELALMHYIPDLKVPADGKVMTTCCVAVIEWNSDGIPRLLHHRRPEKQG